MAIETVMLEEGSEKLEQVPSGTSVGYIGSKEEPIVYRDEDR